jgi:hypothetical protein
MAPLCPVGLECTSYRTTALSGHPVRLATPPPGSPSAPGHGVHGPAEIMKSTTRSSHLGAANLMVNFGKGRTVIGSDRANRRRSRGFTGAAAPRSTGRGPTVYFWAVTWVAVMMPSASAVPWTTTVAPTGMSFALPVCTTRTVVVPEVFTVTVSPLAVVR